MWNFHESKCSRKSSRKSSRVQIFAVISRFCVLVVGRAKIAKIWTSLKFPTIRYENYFNSQLLLRLSLHWDYLSTDRPSIRTSGLWTSTYYWTPRQWPYLRFCSNCVPDARTGDCWYWFLAYSSEGPQTGNNLQTQTAFPWDCKTFEPNFNLLYSTSFPLPLPACHAAKLEEEGGWDYIERSHDMAPYTLVPCFVSFAWQCKQWRHATV